MRAPPSERKKFIDAVAMPSSLRSTAFWIAMVDSGSTVPMPIDRSASITSISQNGSCISKTARTVQQARLTPIMTTGTRLYRSK